MSNLQEWPDDHEAKMGGFSFILHINYEGLVTMTVEYKLLSLKHLRGPN